MKKLKILFLRTGNSCRSQMAEGWAKYLKSDSIEAFSAGVEPHGMNDFAIAVMKEAGVDRAHAGSRRRGSMLAYHPRKPCNHPRTAVTP